MSPARTAPRLRPDPDMVLVTLLRPRLPREALVVNLRPARFLSRLPVITMRAVSPGSFDQTRNLRHRWPIGIDVQCWAGTRRGASNLDDAVLRALVDAHELGASAAGAYVAGLAVDTPGAEVRDPDQPARLFRWQASYSLILRPA